MKKVLYTCVTPGYDTVVPQSVPEDWELRVFSGSDPSLSAQRQARNVKLCPHWFFEFDVCIWFDGNCRIVDPTFYERTEDLVLLKHPDRSNILQEAAACKRLSKATPKEIDVQVATYLRHGMPRDLPLPATGAVFRRNTQQIISFCEEWWHQLSEYTARDQLSFNYVAWKLCVPFVLVDYDTTIVKEQPHNVKLRYGRPVVKVDRGASAPIVKQKQPSVLARYAAIADRYARGKRLMQERMVSRRTVQVGRHGNVELPEHLVIPRVQRVRSVQ